MSQTFSIKPALVSGAVSLLALAATSPAYAQDVLDIGEVVVTPNRTPTEKSKVGSSVDVVEEEKIDTQSLPVLVDYLSQVPGISTTSPGGRGQEGSLTLRGADKKYVKTLFNGIDISDPTSTQVQTSYQHLLAGGITGIEVLKGPQSTLYGSDAVAGVISIGTLGDIAPGLHHGFTVEGGSQGTIYSGYDLSGAGDSGRFAANFFGLRTEGISVASEHDGNSELDSYRNLTATFAGEQALSENLTVFGAGIWIKARNELDNGFPFRDEPTSFGENEQLAGRAGFNLDLLDGRFRNTFAVQAYRLERYQELNNLNFANDYDRMSEINTAGRRFKAEYQGTLDVNEALILMGGLDYDRQAIRSRDDTTEFIDFAGTPIVPPLATETSLGGNVWNVGTWAQAIWTPVDNLTLTGGLRYDNHEFFGGHTTGRVTAAYLIDSGTKVRGSVGTGFRAPSLYELFAPQPYAGNPDLQPETSLGWDIGIDQAFLDERLTASLTYFSLDIEDLIGFTFSGCCSGFYDQVEGTTKRRGVEASITYNVNAWLDLGAAYTYTHTEEPSGDRRIRIPRHQAALSTTVRPAERWTVSATALIAADAIDTNFDAFPSQTVDLDDYVLLNAKVAYKPTDETEVYLRVENLLDQEYETVRGFGTPGFSAYAGFKAVF